MENNKLNAICNLGDKFYYNNGNELIQILYSINFTKEYYKINDDEYNRFNAYQNINCNHEFKQIATEQKRSADESFTTTLLCNLCGFIKYID